MNNDTGRSEEQQIASDRLDELRENPQRTAQVSVHAGRHPYVRYEPPVEMYEIAEVSGVGNIEVTAVTKDDLLNLFAENPVEIKPLTQALYSPPEPGTSHIWKAVDVLADEVTYVNLQEADTNRSQEADR